MNRIEEMMKAAGVENDCIDCKASNMIKPDCASCFTAEKQLKIIKLIGKTTDLHYWGGGMSSLANNTDEDIIGVENDDFTQALAQLTTELMKVGELDKEKIKKILQDEI